MPREPLPDTSLPVETANPEPDSHSSDIGASDSDELPVDLSEFSQRLASFGLGEAPDPLLTEARPPVKRRSRS